MQPYPGQYPPQAYATGQAYPQPGYGTQQGYQQYPGQQPAYPGMPQQYATQGGYAAYPAQPQQQQGWVCSTCPSALTVVVRVLLCQIVATRTPSLSTVVLFR